jgi:hypothetical protein
MKHYRGYEVGELLFFSGYDTWKPISSHVDRTGMINATGKERSPSACGATVIANVVIRQNGYLDAVLIVLTMKGEIVYAYDVTAQKVKSTINQR